MRKLNLVLGLWACAAAVAVIGCKSTAKTPATIPQVSRQPFGKLPTGEQIDVYTLRNSKGAEARIINYGGLVISLKVPDRHGVMGDVVLGYDNLPGYLKSSPYFGALIGRFGNRIAHGRFTLDGKTYDLPRNDGPNTLHGGIKGFDKVVWTAKVLATSEGPAVELTYLSHDGEEGFPGNLNVTAIYTLTEQNGLTVEFAATTDKPTVVNLTQHSYFNLAGRGTILDHVVMIPANRFTPVDSTLIPTGVLQPVENTAFDFRTPTPIGARIQQDNEQLKFGKGYDHNWVLNKTAGKLELCARVEESTTGRVLEVLSTEPGLQFYTGNFLDGTITGKGGWVYQFRSGFTMEPQHFPDSPNKPEFPSVTLRPGQVYKNTIVYRFSAR